MVGLLIQQFVCQANDNTGFSCTAPRRRTGPHANPASGAANTFDQPFLGPGFARVSSLLYNDVMYVTRFAPSPTGPLHLGNALSALVGWTRARERRGRFILRIEDIDTARCRPEHDGAARDDIAWLGIDWDGPVLRQSERGAIYAEAIAKLRAMGLEYPCFCSRADIAAAASAPHGPNGPIYPGTCRHLPDAERRARMAQEPFAWRLDVAAALARTGPLTWQDSHAGLVSATPQTSGDIVVGRKQVGVSYHLAVVIDDAAQGVTEVVRGADLFAATHVQRLLQALLRLPTPTYHHHGLLTGPDGRRLAKRDGAPTLAALRLAGTDPAAVRAALIPAADGPATPWRLGETGLQPQMGADR